MLMKTCTSWAGHQRSGGTSVPTTGATAQIRNATEPRSAPSLWTGFPQECLLLRVQSEGGPPTPRPHCQPGPQENQVQALEWLQKAVGTRVPQSVCKPKQQGFCFDKRHRRTDSQQEAASEADRPVNLNLLKQ